MEKIVPKKLTPPKEAMDRFIKNDKKRIPSNPVKKFFKIFFGEGF